MSAEHVVSADVRRGGPLQQHALHRRHVVLLFLNRRDYRDDFYQDADQHIHYHHIGQQYEDEEEYREQEMLARHRVDGRLNVRENAAYQQRAHGGQHVGADGALEVGTLGELGEDDRECVDDQEQEAPNHDHGPGDDHDAVDDHHHLRHRLQQAGDARSPRQAEEPDHAEDRRGAGAGGDGPSGGPYDDGEDPGLEDHEEDDDEVEHEP